MPTIQHFLGKIYVDPGTWYLFVPEVLTNLQQIGSSSTYIDVRYWPKADIQRASS